MVPTFRELVFALVRRVPPGRVTSYGRVAAALGQSRKAREVGWALGSIPEHEDLNAHRVVRQDGSMAGGLAFGAPEIQRALLWEEGVRFLLDGRVDLERHLWSEQAMRHAALEVLKLVEAPERGPFSGKLHSTARTSHNRSGSVRRRFRWVYSVCGWTAVGKTPRLRISRRLP
jgi:methylated-DNA-protein-cysteine methyltransferase-like protein